MNRSEYHLRLTEMKDNIVIHPVDAEYTLHQVQEENEKNLVDQNKSIVIEELYRATNKELDPSGIPNTALMGQWHK